MKMGTRLCRNVSVSIALSTVLLLSAGCATNGRRILLKEYGPTVPVLTDSPLKGKTICLRGFHCASDLIAPDPKTKPEQLTQFRRVDFTSEQGKTWDKDYDVVKKSTKESD